MATGVYYRSSTVSLRPGVCQAGGRIILRNGGKRPAARWTALQNNVPLGCDTAGTSCRQTGLLLFSAAFPSFAYPACMDRRFPLAVLWLAACGASVGCHFRGFDGPVPRSLLLSRQLSQQGVSAMERGDWVRADELLAQAVKVFPQDAEARLHYAEVLWQRGGKTAALEQIDEALALSPDDARLLASAVQMKIATGQCRAADELIERALDVDPKNGSLWTLRGRLRQRAGQPREALADYHRALGYRPGDRDTLLQVAELYRQLNQPQRALAALQTLSESYPPGEEPTEVLYLTGLAYRALGRYAEAADALALALDRGPPAAETLYRLAEAQLKAGRRSESRQTALRLLALAPDHAGAVFLIERSYVAQQAAPRLR